MSSVAPPLAASDIGLPQAASSWARVAPRQRCRDAS